MTVSLVNAIFLSAANRENITWSDSKTTIPESGCDVCLTFPDDGFITVLKGPWLGANSV